MKPSTILAAMQPTYLPWPGYFNLIYRSDVFIFLDDAKLEKSSWHTRNKILINGKENFINVTLDCSRLVSIQEATLGNQIPWRKKHQQTLEMTYKNSPHGKAMLERIVPIITDDKITSLAKLNMGIIQEILRMMGLEKKIVLSSELGIDGKRSERLMNFCRYFQADLYLSPVGSKEYIEEDQVFARENFPVEYQNFPSRPYKQFNSNTFIPYLSILDILSNLGAEETLAYIKQ